MEQLDIAILLNLAPVILVFYGAYRDIYTPSYPKGTNDTHTNDTHINDKSTNYNTTGTNNTKIHDLGLCQG